MTGAAPSLDQFLALQQRVARVEYLLAGLAPEDRSKLVEAPIAAIVTDAARALGIDRRAITSSMSEAWLHRARFAVAWTARKAFGFTLARIARALGRGDHTTARHQISRAEQLRETDPAFLILTDRLLEAAEQRRGAQ